MDHQLLIKIIILMSDMARCPKKFKRKITKMLTVIITIMIEVYYIIGIGHIDELINR